MEMMSTTAIEHGSTRPGRWLRERRLRLTMWIALGEGVLYLVHVLHWWEAVALAAITVGFWWYAGRSSRSDLIRQATWIAAASQLLVLCVPVALAVLSAIAIGVIALLAIAALIILFRERA
jgi:hypothetical protein